MVKLQRILDSVSTIEFIGESETQIGAVVSIAEVNSSANNLTWCNDKNIGQLESLQKGTVIISQASLTKLKANHGLSGAVNYIIVENPRNTFKTILSNFFAPEVEAPKIEASASIAYGVKVAKSNYIGKNVVLEKNVVLGEHVRIGHNTVLHAGTIVKSNVNIGCNCTIGGVGFGYEKNEIGENEVMPHIGNVTIGHNVDVGNNTCIDRAVLGSTEIGDNVKIDNLVHIAHGVTIGKNSLIIAQSMIAGSVKIGENVWVAPSSSIIQKVEIGDNATIGLGSVVLKDVKENSTVVGVPAKPLTGSKD